jgi:GNAT superfamily N-acetyltransferase
VFRLRAATDADIPVIAALIETSVRGLQAEDYSVEQMNGAIGTVFGVDSQLIADGTYFVVETESGVLAGCGGWSKRATLFGADAAAVRENKLLDPRVDAARIRAFFVHPDWARQGIGSLLLEACEQAAVEGGFARLELGATLTGERLYSARGYCAVERIEVPLVNGATLPVIRMTKSAHDRIGMMQLAKGTFEVKMTPHATGMSLDKGYHGDLEATSQGQMLTAQTSVKGSAGYVAIEQVSGTLHGRSGTFILQHSGTMNRGTPQQSITVVPDSGTGELDGTSGNMTIHIADGKHSYEFEYTISG